MWTHLEASKRGLKDDISAFVAHRGCAGREVKKDKTNRARRRVKAKRSDVDLEFLTREFHPRIVPVEEERVQSDIKKGQFSFLQVDALVTPSVD